MKSVKAMSIKTRVSVTAAVFMTILTAAIAIVGYKLYYDNMMERYVAYTDTVLNYAYRACEEYSFGDMIASRSMPENYEKLRTELNKVKECSDIEYLYAIYFDDINDIHSLHYAINAKTQEELNSGKPLSEIYSYMGKPCEKDGFADDTLQTLWEAVKSQKRENGTLDGVSDKYGHMLNGYRVVFDSADNPAGLICVEIDIYRIHINMRRYVIAVVFIAFVLTAVIILIYLFSTQRNLINPIIRITESSDAFVKKMQSNADPETLIFEPANVTSGKELCHLADNVKSLADGVASYMTNLQAVTTERERISTELSLAQRIQASMLPHIFPPYPDRQEFDIYAIMEPAKEVGGDFYDFFLIDEDHLCIVMADVSGKGIPAALFMMIAKTILQSCAMLGKSAAEILTKTNEALCTNNQVEMFVTVWLGILEISTGKLTCANAGHEYPMLKQNGGEYVLYKDKHSFPVGGMEGMRYMEYEIQLRAGDRLFLYTDGVPEAADAQNEMFGYDRMLDVLNGADHDTPQEILHHVREAVSGFVRDAEQFDDLTMLCMEYRGNAGRNPS